VARRARRGGRGDGISGSGRADRARRLRDHGRAEQDARRSAARPEVVLEWLERRFTGPWLILPRGAARNALRAAVGAGIRGGALYDALIAATAAHHAHRLLSADRRAATTYAALGLDVVYVTA
jgi:predicted nucleic acid-binding protein